MDIPTFAVEAWMNSYGKQAQYNIADTCADCMTLNELLAFGGDKKAAILRQEICNMTLNYGDITGSPEIKTLVAARYGPGVSPDNVIIMNGALLTNYLVFYTLIQPGDHVVAFHPSYQQLYEVPISLGAKVDLLHLQPEMNFVPELDKLRELVRPDTKLIVINNPNNPTGTLLDGEMLMQIAAIARSCGAYILCDEVCLNLWTDKRLTVPSIYTVYEKGIATSSLSKAMSFPGLRVGWMIASQEVISACLKQRDYVTISCGVLHDRLSIHVLTHYDEILERNRAILRKNLDILEDWVASEPQITYVRPRAGTATLLKVDLPYTSEVFCKNLLKATGVLLTPGSCFEMEGYVRIGCATQTEMFKEGLARTSNFIMRSH